MIEIYAAGKNRIVTLTTEEILELHTILCDNYKLLPEMEPVSPPGVKNQTMLESAVSRQLVGSADYYKYPDVYSNCATLVFGLVKNHSFHNGNKRIGFLAMLKHLYVNGNVLSPNVQHREIFELLRCLADKSLKSHAEIYFKHFFKTYKRIEWSDDLQIRYLSSWLRSSTEHKNTKIKRSSLSVNELERLLKAKNLSTKFSGKYLTVVRPNSFFQEILWKKPYKKEYLIKDGRNVSLNHIEQIRRDFEISFADGVDNSSFYNGEDFLSREIVAYKKIIYKLAKT
jgi:death-on-curing family protein